MRKSNIWIVWLYAFFWPTGCTQERPVEYVNTGAGEDSGQVKGVMTSASNKKLRFATMLTDAASGQSLVADPNLSLVADASAFTIKLTACTSTPENDITKASVYLEVYEFDRNCLAKLETFTLNEKIYTPKSGSLFDTWQIGDVATFEVLDEGEPVVPADELRIEVIDTISKTSVVAGPAIHYQFSELTKGTSDDPLEESDVRVSAEMKVDGQASPDFHIARSSLVGITSDGNAVFQFVLECNDSVNKITGNGATLACFDVRLNTIYMVLAEDTFDGDEPTSADLDTIYGPGNDGPGTLIADANKFTANQGTPVLANGGFSSAAPVDADHVGDAMVMRGVKPINDKPHMLFILKSGPSYTYFHIDVTIINQNGSGP